MCLCGSPNDPRAQFMPSVTSGGACLTPRQFIVENPEEAAAELEAANSVALEAHGLVHGDRNVAYGHPLDDFSKTARHWTNLLYDLGILAPGAEIAPEHVGLMMILAKISRQVNAHKRDNLTDIAGYAETVNRVIVERARREAEVDF
jgi:hypothetical protein